MSARGSGPRRPAAFLVTLTMVAAASLPGCGDADPAAPAPVPAGTLTLPLHVHVLSSQVGAIDSKLSDLEVGALVARVNEVWAQADIVWELRSIVREEALAEEEMEQALEAGTPFELSRVATVIPRGHLTPGSWDAFLVRDLVSVAGAPGVYLAQIPAAVSSELDPVGLDDPGRIFAHELGHSLTLPHAACTPAGNLMAPGCGGDDPTRLSPAQIEHARVQAGKGRPSPF